ncbi:MAG TPA: class I SAM-dependent methyltransferase [Verrucomicrobiae bacterium]|nr:class I SAM-dependent methyltransferase [Verrucomicrobiae bacterium]
MPITGARSDWTDGYIADIAYTDGYYVELAPVHLNYVALLNNCTPRPIDRPFNYLELGCGNGHTVTLLAAAYPQAKFYGVDINPAHVATARRWAEQGKLENLTILEASFQELATMDLPEFDFVTFHGIYSWISEANRKAMLDVMARRLLPGGLVYNSYNCQPGWASQGPLQRLMLEIGHEVPGDSLTKAGGAIDFLQKLTTADCRYLQANQGAAELIKKIATNARSYVAHEYLNEEWHPFYCLDVFREMGMAKLSYVGSATITENHPGLLFGKNARPVFDSQPTKERKQLVQDFLINQRFRRDVYVKGLSTMSAAESRNKLRDMSVGLVKSPASVTYTAKCNAGEVKFDNELSRAIIEVLSKGAMTVGELAAQPEVNKTPEARVQSMVHTLIAASQILPFATPATKGGKQTGKLTLPSALNRYVVSTATEPAARGTLASTISGRGIHVGLTDRCFTQEVVNSHAASAPEAVWALLEKRGINVKRGDEVLKGKEANLAELQKEFDTYKSKTLPLLMQLGIIEAR